MIKSVESKEVKPAPTNNEEEQVDDPPEVESAPVPQIKLGPNGEIILDEKSLVSLRSYLSRCDSISRFCSSVIAPKVGALKCYLLE